MLRRRELLFGVLAAAAPLAHAIDLPSFRRIAFDAKTVPQLLDALGLAAPVASKDVLLQAPELFEDGSVVPVTLGCSLPGVRRLLLGVERNPTLLSAIFEPGEALEPNLSTRLKMQETSNVLVLAVMKDGRVLMASQEVKITLGGCGGAAAESEPEQAAQPTLIRVQPTAAGATVRSLMKHEMESGQRKDGSGRTVPAWHIQEVVARVNGQPVLSAQWGTAVSKNPFLQFGVRGIKTGDKVSLAWADNHGVRRSDEVTVA
ncbi:thiosulfate oxidation carrier complex protein SoxZ [Methylibium sp.]|uniref:thiosulfate oxidation carrier complex protein SoxZ n=1 Tax=Methylibium sp. TaxID=2067992 RepID=UPI003D149B48